MLDSLLYQESSHLLESYACQDKNSFSFFTCIVESSNNKFVNRNVFSSLIMSQDSSFKELQ